MGLTGKKNAHPFGFLSFPLSSSVYVHQMYSSSLQLLSVDMITYGILFDCRTVKLWALTGQPLLEMFGHTSLVYSVDAHSSGLIASGSEDRSVKIWKGDLFCMLCRILLKVQ
jgi:WD40 repeat protein